MVLSEIQRVDTDEVEPHIRRQYTRASLIALLGNALLLVSKGIVARTSGSSAIYADAANSASDVAYSVLMLVGLWLSLKPADVSHPHGHRRIEPLVSMSIGIMMTLAGIEAARTGITTWQSGPRPITSVWALIIPLVSALLKGGMYYSVRRLGQTAGSPALLASAQDHLSDMLSSGMVLAGVAASRMIWHAADPLAALLVSLWILRSALSILREGVNQLIGGAASAELFQSVAEAARSVPGVLNVHQVIIEYIGPQVRADIHINMDGALTLDEVHRVSDAVREDVEALKEVDHAYVHVEPLGTGRNDLRGY